jgi:hypothetical protein
MLSLVNKGETTPQVTLETAMRIPSGSLMVTVPAIALQNYMGVVSYPFRSHNEAHRMAPRQLNTNEEVRSDFDIMDTKPRISRAERSVASV